MGELAKEILPVNIEDELKQSYLDYAMSVIIGRALPDARDGLKPVHRRVLYAMSELGNDWNKPYKKSARVVGDVIGKYHPHGDSAVYDTIVRMAQPFSMRYLLVDGQGNFGSVDGDSAAAMRYTEVRMAKLAHELLADLDKETVDWVPNYDGTEQIPAVMPTKVPNLLVNGSSGIAVGMATNIPPHNLGEVIDGCLALIDDPDISIDELMRHIPGPDFPTAGIINGRAGIIEAYRTGRGRIYIRARAEIEDIDKVGGRQQIVVTELPYQLNKARLIEKIAELVKEKKIEGITELRDESDKDGMRVVIELRRIRHQRGSAGRWAAAHAEPQGAAGSLRSPPPRSCHPAYRIRTAQGARARAYSRRSGGRAVQHRSGNRPDQGFADAGRSQGCADFHRLGVERGRSDGRTRRCRCLPSRESRPAVWSARRQVFPFTGTGPGDPRSAPAPTDRPRA